MNARRRSLLALAGLMPVYGMAKEIASEGSALPADQRLVLSDFTKEKEFVIQGARWRGFSDRVMGGVSDVDFTRDVVDGRRCVRMQGNVTRDNGGGFVQMAFYVDADASSYKGLEFLVYGNDEDYNAHVRTADCGWHDDSYRATFHAHARWQTVRLSWDDFQPNRVKEPLDASRLERLGLLGWMRDFTADLAVAEVALYT